MYIKRERERERERQRQGHMFYMTQIHPLTKGGLEALGCSVLTCLHLDPICRLNSYQDHFEALLDIHDTVQLHWELRTIILLTVEIPGKGRTCSHQGTAYATTDLRTASHI